MVFFFFFYLLNINIICNPIEFAEIIRDFVGGRSKIKQQAAVEDDPQRRKPDISRAKKYLNWEPRVSLKIGLQKTIEYFRKELDRSLHSQRNFFLPENNPKMSSSAAERHNEEKPIFTAADDAPLPSLV